MVALHTVVECHIPEDPLADFAGSGDMSSGVKAVLSIDATAVVHYVLSMFTIWALAKFTCRMYAVAAGRCYTSLPAARPLYTGAHRATLYGQPNKGQVGDRSGGACM